MQRSNGNSLAAETEVRNRVRGLLTVIYPGGMIVDRRKDPRFPYPRLIRLTPVGRDGKTPMGDSMVVVGRQISEQGLSFYHEHPLPNRRMLATLEAHDGSSIGFLIDICRCRFTRQGWYESGSRLLQCVVAPPEPTQLTGDEIAPTNLVGVPLSTSQ